MVIDFLKSASEFVKMIDWSYKNRIYILSIFNDHDSFSIFEVYQILNQEPFGDTELLNLSFDIEDLDQALLFKLTWS